MSASCRVRVIGASVDLEAEVRHGDLLPGGNVPECLYVLAVLGGWEVDGVGVTRVVETGETGDVEETVLETVCHSDDDGTGGCS